jgi:hypothetical protein
MWVSRRAGSGISIDEIPRPDSQEAGALAADGLGFSSSCPMLDLALLETRVEALKFVALVAAGAVAPASWRAAGPVVQAFFLGSAWAPN